MTRTLRRDLIFNSLAVCFGLLSFLAGLGLFELALFLFWKPPVSPIENEFDQTQAYFDEYDVNRAKAGARIRSYSRYAGTDRYLYDVTYRFDDYGRRIVDPDAVPGDEHVLLFACSNMFGEGLRDEDTIQYRLSRALPGRSVYNYSFRGLSPSDMLARLESGRLAEQVPEKKGKLIYLYLDAHIFRVVGSMRITNWWAEKAPYYFEDSRGRIVRKGSFKSGRPRLAAVYRFLSKVRILKFFNIDIPGRVEEAHLRLVAKVILEAQKRYREQFPEGEFVLALSVESRHAARLIRYLEKGDIRIVDLSKSFDAENAAATYLLAPPHDLHPNALGARQYADELLRRVFDVNAADRMAA